MATGNYERPDFMSYILEANYTSKALTPTEVTANVALLLDVGSETTASLLAGCLFYLTKSPAILGQLTTEIREHFATVEEMDSKKLSRLPYLQAVLHESLRIYPPVAGATPRVTPPSGCISEFRSMSLKNSLNANALVVDGYFVPGKMIVAINQYATYRASANFKDALEFVPERWLGEDRFQRDKHIVFQPFSHGARNCMGRKYWRVWLTISYQLGVG
ncbi:benzoate 4-monooxygenase cytochrome P450 [Colletotrichum tofieldiae]|nr:benzoate 4-monooxygenase cytochrome p450 [Colletotrichum tofieldiae]GKT78540.1 benzoate 4-monooxygenase cytochrome P450 [Colletotrichum tofieldiae]GKT85909.1 benzoate 4-monooxygenase cytochrome p450 [Colletotrichum tofieldiae]